MVRTAAVFHLRFLLLLLLFATSFSVARHISFLSLLFFAGIEESLSAVALVVVQSSNSSGFLRAAHFYAF